MGMGGWDGITGLVGEDLSGRQLSEGERVGNVGFAISGVVLQGQMHHVFSNKIMRELGRHRVLKGVFRRNDLITQGLDESSHIGYQTWHRQYDDEVVEWLTNPDNVNVTKNEFLQFLEEVYERADMNERFPNAVEQIIQLME